MSSDYGPQRRVLVLAFIAFTSAFAVWMMCWVLGLPIRKEFGLHAINFFILVALFPFSRLVHMLSVPLAYLCRPYQIVLWHRR